VISKINLFLSFKYLLSQIRILLIQSGFILLIQFQSLINLSLLLLFELQKL